MAEKEKKETAGFVKAAEVAKLLDLTIQRVGQLRKEGVFKQYKTAAGDRYNLVETVKAYIKYLRDLNSGKKNPWGDKRDKAEAEYKEAKARRAELELQELQGKMHRSEDVEAVITDLVYVIRGSIVALPGRLAVDTAAAATPAETSAIIRAEVYKVLGELANYKYDPAEFQRRVRDREGIGDLANDVEEND